MCCSISAGTCERNWLSKAVTAVRIASFTGSITTNKIDVCSMSTSAILGLALMYYKSFLSPPPPL